MDEPSNKPAQDTAEYVVEYYAVCVLDLLGQSDRLDGWARLPTDGQPTDELIRAFGDTAHRILEFKTMFVDHFTNFADRDLSADQLSKLSPKQVEQRDRMRGATISTQQFSDTFVFYSPLLNRHGDVTGAAIDVMLGAASLGLRTGLAMGSPARGGIVVGAGTEIDEANFYGPALAAAHRIESRIAEYPRVVVSQEAVAFANRKTGFSRDPEIEGLMRRLKAGPQEYVCVDKDGSTIADFMGEGIHSLVGESPEFRNAAHKAYRYARSEATRLKTEGCTKLAERYARLLDYMKPRLALWGVEI